VTVLRGGTPDRVPVTAYEFSRFDSRRPLSDPGYAAIAEMQRKWGETFRPANVDFGTGLGDPNVVAEGSGDLRAPEQRRVTLPTPAGDLTGISRREPGTITWWTVKPLLETGEDCRKWLSLPDRPVRPDVGAVLAAQEEVGEEGLVLLGPGDALGVVCGMFRFEGFITTLLDDEGLILEMLRRVAARLNDGLRHLCRRVRDVCIRFWGPEYAAAPLLDPKAYFPRLVVDMDREAFEIVNASGNFSVLHCHGRLGGVLDGIAELSPTMLEPLEVLPASTADVTLGELKARLGGSTCLFGGVQAAELERLAPDALRARLREVIEAGMPGGRFGLLPTSAPIEYPLSRRVVDAYRVFFQAAHEFGTY